MLLRWQVAISTGFFIIAKTTATVIGTARDTDGGHIFGSENVACIGLFIGLAGRTIVRSYLVTRIGIVDPWILGMVPLPLILAAFCACYLPASRAARVDPHTALKDL